MLVGVAVGIAVLAAVWLYLLYGPLTTALDEQQRTGLEIAARLTASAIQEVGAGPALQETVRRLGEQSGVRLTVIDPDGVVVADSLADPATMENHADRPEVIDALQGRVGVSARPSKTLGTQYLYVAVPVLSEAAHNIAVVRASEPLAHAKDVTGGVRRAGVALLILALAVAFGATWRLAGAFALPVERLAGAAETMARGDLAVRLEEAPGPLQPLAASLAYLRDQLQKRLAQLEGERARLQEVIDGLDDAVLLVENGVIQACNRAALDLFGGPIARSLEGHRLEDLHGPESLKTAVASALQTTARSEATVGPTPLQQTFVVRTMPLTAHHESAAHLIVVSDITRASRLDAMRRDFVANASHELKTPATGILLLAESAAAATKDGDADQTLAFLSQIHQEAERLRALVADLLDLSRLETEPTAGGPVDVRAAVDLAVTAHRRAAEDKGLSLAVDDSSVEGRDVYATCDATDLAIALDNVLANAIAYTDSGSVTVRLSRENGSIVVKVEDTGVGIPAEHLPRVFERFYRVDAARSRNSGGTGLGLALVKHAMERCGGTAVIASEVGHGTTVTLTLPAA
ncbi:MAG: ATP-binding protein [Coriobacteriia bacterium]|nr:ATP-binding protein [Coriobacteriia bacterium]